MLRSGDILLWPSVLVGMGVALLNMLCALPAHHLAYRRGYLRLGFWLGLFLGPPGIFAASILHPKQHPMVALENELAYHTNDLTSDRWNRCTIAGLTGVFFLAMTVTLMFQQANVKDVSVFAALAAVFIGVALVFLPSAQPPLYMLPPVHEHHELGTTDLLEWIGIRHYAANLQRTANGLYLLCILAWTLAFLAAFFGWACFIDNDSGVRRVMLPLGIGLCASVPLLAAGGLWARNSSRGRRQRFSEMYFELFPAHTHSDFSGPEPDEMEQRIKWRYSRILKQIGHSKDKAMHFAVTTEQTVESTRRSLQVRTLTYGAGGYLIFKVLWIVMTSHSVIDSIKDVATGFTNHETALRSWEILGIGSALILVILMVGKWQRRRRYW
jgi:hypothetical protein